MPKELRFVSGGEPQKIDHMFEGKEKPASPQKKEQPSKRVVKIDKFSWNDEDDKIKIYITDATVLAAAKKSGAVLKASVDGGTGVDLTFTIDEEPGCATACVYKLAATLQAEVSIVKEPRVGGSKVSVTLHKKDKDDKWYNLQKKE